VLAGFHAGTTSWSNWNLKMMFLRGGKLEYPEKTLGEIREPTTNPHMAPGRNRTLANLLAGEHAIPAPQHYTAQ